MALLSLEERLEWGCGKMGEWRSPCSGRQGLDFLEQPQLPCTRVSTAQDTKPFPYFPPGLQLPKRGWDGCAVSPVKASQLWPQDPWTQEAILRVHRIWLPFWPGNSVLSQSHIRHVYWWKGDRSSQTLGLVRLTAPWWPGQGHFKRCIWDLRCSDSTYQTLPSRTRLYWHLNFIQNWLN